MYSKRKLVAISIKQVYYRAPYWRPASSSLLGKESQDFGIAPTGYSPKGINFQSKSCLEKFMNVSKSEFGGNWESGPTGNIIILHIQTSGELSRESPEQHFHHIILDNFIASAVFLRLVFFSNNFIPLCTGENYPQKKTFPLLSYFPSPPCISLKHLTS